MTDNIALARSLGLNVIPLQNSGDLKKPTIDWKAYQTTKYEGFISGNYGVICGKISGDLFVVDLDTADLYSVFAGFAKDTLVVKTGKGYHLYFRWIGKEAKTVPLINKAGQKLDIRSEGAYVVGFGSKHESGSTYEIISQTTNIMSIETKVIKDILQNLGFDVDKGQGKKPIDEILKGVSSGERNNSAFKYACHLMGRVGLTEDLAWHEMTRWNSTNVPPIPEFELKTVFASAKKRIIHDRTIAGLMDNYINQEEPSKEQPKDETSLEPTLKMRSISSKNEGQVITFDCMIAAMEEQKTVTIEAMFICSHCANEKYKEGNGYENVTPPFCKDCQSKMSMQSKTKKTIDIRTIVLQEQPEETLNNQPSRLMAKVNGENVKKVFIGQRKRITGEFISKEDKSKEENTPIILVSKVDDIDEKDDVTLTNEEVNTIKKDIDNDFIVTKIVPSFAPDVYGHNEIKELMLYVIAGGVKIGRRRGDINLFIPGNPSKGKSQMLKFAKLVTGKSTYVNGRGSSAAGLLYGMVKLPNGTSIPQPGPFVLNSGGFVLIDELDKMAKSDRIGLLEAMEQQTVSLAKAGVNLTVKAETAVIAAANPHFGRWDTGLSIMDNLQPLEKPLISRFDIIYPIINVSKEMNSKIADHIVNQGTGDIILTYMDIATLKHYLTYVKKLSPTLSKEAGDKIKKFYHDTLEAMEKVKDSLPMEERQLEGLIRLSTARAKLLMKDAVDCDDVERIMYLYKKSIEEFGIKGNDISGYVNLNTTNESEQQIFLKIFKSLRDSDGLVLGSDLKDAIAKSEKFSTKNADEVIEKARKDGMIYMPRDNVYKEATK